MSDGSGNSGREDAVSFLAGFTQMRAVTALVARPPEMFLPLDAIVPFQRTAAEIETRVRFLLHLIRQRSARR